MKKTAALEKFFRGYDIQISVMMILVVTVRKLTFMSYTPYQRLALVLLGSTAILFLLFPFISRRIHRWIWLYIGLQIAIIEMLGLLPPFEDTWGLLYFPLWAEVKTIVEGKKAYYVIGGLGVFLTFTLMNTFDWLIGLGYGVFMSAVGFILISPDLIYTQFEQARDESVRLLKELRKTTSRLKKAAQQAEELSVIQERMRLANELHDSVSQLMFSIRLLAQSTRLMLDKDPEAVPKQLDQLQELSSRALQQMRSLITQWRADNESVPHSIYKN